MPFFFGNSLDAKGSIHTQVVMPRNTWWLGALVHNTDSRTILSGHAALVAKRSGSSYLNAEIPRNPAINPTLGYALNNIEPGGTGVVVMLGFAFSHLQMTEAVTSFGTWLKADTARGRAGRWEKMGTASSSSVGWSAMMNLGVATTDTKTVSGFATFRRW